MARTLKAVVFVDGMPYAPGDDIPDDVATRIGDHAWTDEAPRAAKTRNGVGDPVPAPYAGVASQRAPEDAADEDADGQGDGDGQGDDDAERRSLVTAEGGDDLLVDKSGDEPVAPPRSGKGSGVEAWRAYARQLGVEPAANADRDDIIAAIDAHRLAQRDA